MKMSRCEGLCQEDSETECVCMFKREIERLKAYCIPGFSTSSTENEISGIKLELKKLVV